MAINHVQVQLSKFLRSKGLWEDFVVRRNRIMESDGCGEMLANRKAAEEMFGEGLVPKEFVPVSRGKPKIYYPEMKEAGDVRRSVFKGKSCSIYSAVVWAYENHRFVEVGPKDAPSAMAWNMLLDMRESQSTKEGLVKTFVGKGISSYDGEGVDRNVFDGKGVYDLLGAIEESSGGAG